MKLTFLGTGTSQGIPVIGCRCPVCLSNDVRDCRLRSSVFIEKENFHLLIDVSPDLRSQLLANEIDRIDSILITHEHNDHVAGLDDIRPINFKWRKNIPLYTLPRVIEELKTRFYYAFEDYYKARPRISVAPIDFGDRLKVGPIDIDVLEVDHGYLDILGFKMDNLAYLTDVKSLPENTIQRIKGIDTLVMSALHKDKHNSHQSLEDALKMIDRIGPRVTYLMHISHNMGLHVIESKALPKDVHFAYDGLTLDISV